MIFFAIIKDRPNIYHDSVHFLFFFNGELSKLNPN